MSRLLMVACAALAGASLSACGTLDMSGSSSSIPPDGGAGGASDGGTATDAGSGNADAGVGNVDGGLDASVDAGSDGGGGGAGDGSVGGGSGGRGGGGDGSGGGDGGGGGGGTGDGGGSGGGGTVSCSQPGFTALTARSYVIDPAGRQPEYSTGDGSGNLLFGVSGPGSPSNNEAPLVSTDGKTKFYLGFAKGAHLHGEPSGFSGTIGSFSGHFSVGHLDGEGKVTGEINYQMAADANVPIIPIADPRSGTMILGKFRTLSEPESAASRRAAFVSAAPAELWSTTLASAGAVFGAGLDLAGNAIVITDGSGRWGAGAISAQWISSSGKDLTGEFLLISGFQAASNTWFEVSALASRDVAIRRVDATDYRGLDVRSQYLCVIGPGATACDAPPEWLASRRNARIEPVRSGAAYAVLPDPTAVSDCKQTVEVLDTNGASCGSMELRMAEGSCQTRALAVGKDGTLIQPLADKAWVCTPAERGCRPTWRWWPRLFR